MTVFPMQHASHPDNLTGGGDLRDQLLRLNWLQHRRFAQQISDLNLTVPQFYTLSTLVALGGESTMGMLARQTHQVSATMTGIIDRLVAASLVERRRGKRDRRSVLVAITPEGKQLVEMAWGRALSSLDDAVAELSPTERTGAAKFIDTLVNLMQD